MVRNSLQRIIAIRLERKLAKINSMQIDDSTRANFYTKQLSNGEKFFRRWLVYSKFKDSVFCFACKLFSSNNRMTLKTGFDDWNHIAAHLAEHERTTAHRDSMLSWARLESTDKKGTVDDAHQRMISSNISYWKDLLFRIFTFIRYLARQNIAFRGNKDTLFVPDNGNFLQLVETVATMDPVIMQHLRKEHNSNKPHFLSHSIQNEIIGLIAKATESVIIEKLHKTRYFSLFLDTTPDASKQDQMSICARFVDCSTEPNQDGKYVQIREHFLSYKDVNVTTGEALADEAIAEDKDMIMVET